MRFPLQISVAVVVLASAATAQGQMRFQGMDTNGDGVITRREWRGNDNSFRNQDWNGDGILSGNEVRTGARRQSGWSEDWNQDGRVDNLDNQIAQRFRGYDMNSDSRVGRSEWRGDTRLFTRLDANRDGYLSMQEYSQGGGFTLDSLGGASYRFSNIDVNGDGLITRNEWNMNSADFNRLDANRDNRISRFEFENDTAASNDHGYSAAQFNAFDANRDGWLTRAESGMRTGEFDRLDSNRDNRVSRFEFENGSTASDTTYGKNRSGAWRTGHDRGTQEGRAAGREDFIRHQGWDLEGQRELEQADSGYTRQMGTLSDYQAGYREAFRIAYRAGFAEAGGKPPR
jgi:Ca2+-binding EF-hand superfamily protein